MFKGFRSRKSNIDPIKDAALDRALNDKGQQFVAQSVKNLSEDEPSMAWRAALNDKLVTASSDSKRRAQRQRTWRPAISLAATGALALAIISQRGMTPTAPVSTSNAIEFAAVDAHLEAERSLDLGSIQVVSQDTGSTISNSSNSWEDADLGTF